MRQLVVFTCCAGIALAWASVFVLDQPPGGLSADDLQFYQQKVQPILSAQCFSCHSHKEKKKTIYIADSLGMLVMASIDIENVVDGARAGN